jgi:hypothetical protein
VYKLKWIDVSTAAKKLVLFKLHGERILPMNSIKEAGSSCNAVVMCFSVEGLVRG